MFNTNKINTIIGGVCMKDNKVIYEKPVMLNVEKDKCYCNLKYKVNKNEKNVK